MKVVLVLSALIVLLAAQEFHGKNHADNIPKLFSAAYTKFHGDDGFQALLKRADSEEIKERLENFRVAVETVEDVRDNPATRFTAALNHISVMTAAEKRALLNLKPTNTTKLLNARSTATQRRLKRQTPASVNWVSRGAQPAVKNQGACGSCWAFGAVSALEGQYYALTGDLVAFSEQEYLDCTMEHFYKKHKHDWANGKSGCTGAWMDWAYDYTKDVGRMASLADFPYKAQDRDCNMKGVSDAMVKTKLTGVDFSMRGDDSKLAAATAEGVVTVAIAVVDDFSYYRTGIFECLPGAGCDCSKAVNHAVTVVGYKSDYWTVRNSWGSNWGDGGYIKMSRAQSNICNINRYSQVPVLECKAGQTCDGWDDNDNDGDDDEDEDEDDADFDTGSDLECGEIEHFGGLCVDLDDTASHYASLTSAGCSREFCLTSKGYLKDQATDMCLTVSDPDEQNGMVMFGRCSKAYTWETTEKGFRIKESSGKCWHPNGGTANPTEDTNVVIWSGCDEDRLTFQIKESVCWEERDGEKLGKKMKDSTGKAMKSKKLNKAKDLCMDTEGCTGLNYNGKVYSLAAAKKSKASNSTTAKLFLLVSCQESCDTGLQRCDDGECKEQCRKGDNDCPSGTTRCNDGVCSHEHMCH